MLPSALPTTIYNCEQWGSTIAEFFRSRSSPLGLTISTASQMLSEWGVIGGVVNLLGNRKKPNPHQTITGPPSLHLRYPLTDESIGLTAIRRNVISRSDDLKRQSTEETRLKIE